MGSARSLRSLTRILAPWRRLWRHLWRRLWRRLLSTRAHRFCRAIGFVQLAGIITWLGVAFATASELRAGRVVLRGTVNIHAGIGIAYAATLIRTSAQSATDGSAACLGRKASKSCPNEPGAVMSVVFMVSLVSSLSYYGVSGVIIELFAS